MRTIQPRRVAALAALGTVFLWASCDSTGPEPEPVVMELRLEPSEPYLAPDEEGAVRVECGVTMTLSASGPPDGVATLGGGAWRWYWGQDLTVPGQTDTLTQEQAREFWGRGTLAVGETATSWWRVWAGFPFALEVEFRYRASVGAPVQLARDRMECGVGGVNGDAPAPPVVAEVEVETPSPFQPGDRYTVSYRATAAAGLWQTRITVRGAYQAEHLLSEELAGETVRSVELAVPPGVVLGEPLDITVDARDTRGQGSAPVTRQTASLVDETPPGVFRVTTGLVLAPGETAWLVGQYAVGDTVRLLVAASDNHALGELIVRVGADDRRLPMEGAHVTELFEVEAEPAWEGSPGFAVQITDAQGLEGPHHQAHPDSIRFYPLASGAVASVAVEGEFADAAWDEARDLLYMARGDEVLVLSTASSPGMPTERTLSLPEPIGGLDLTPDGATLVVSLPGRGTVAVVDLATGQVTEHATAAAGLERPWRVRVTAHGRALVVGRTAEDVVVTVELDPTSGQVARRHDAPTFPSHAMPRVERNAAGSAVGVVAGECLAVYSAATDRFGTCVHASRPGTLAVDASGQRFLVGAMLVDIASGATSAVGWGLSPYGYDVSAFAADGESVFLSDVRGLIRVRVDDGVALHRVPLHRVYGRILPAADGRRLITVANDLDSWPRRVRIDRVELDGWASPSAP
jgi:hypothetical protein